MLGNSEAVENKEWEARVSGGRGKGYAECDHHAGGKAEGGKVRTDVGKGKHQFNRDSIFSKKGKGRGKASRKI